MIGKIVFFSALQAVDTLAAIPIDQQADATLQIWPLERMVFHQNRTVSAAKDPKRLRVLVDAARPLCSGVGQLV